MNRILFAARLFFIISTLFTGTVLKAQTFNLVKEINTTATTNSIGSTLMQRVGTTVYFVANDGISGNELWKTEGTAASTMLVKDIRSGINGSVIANMIEANGLLYFSADDGVNGAELWRSDGTPGGTYMVKDIRPGSTGSGIIQIYNHNGTVFFSANDGTNGLELWKTDGTEAGTIMVKDINPGTGSSMNTAASPNAFISMGTDLYFAASTSLNGRELWKSDGTEAGTVMVKDILAGTSSAIANHKASVAKGKLYFAASNGSGVNGTELWATDGTDAGTYLVKDIAIGSANASPNNLITFSGTLFFTASNTNNGTPDLWKTDGTNAGTVMVRNFVADGVGLTVGFNNTNNQFTIIGNKLFFVNNSGPLGAELYATDSTTAGTGIVKDILPGQNGSFPSSLMSFNGKLYFSVIEQTFGSERKLYASDGTTAGTSRVTDVELSTILSVSTGNFVSTANQLFFGGTTIDQGTEVWKTDGSSSGTNLVVDINTTLNGTPNSGATLFGSTTMNGYYYFAAANTTQGLEIWKSNGTEAGTVMLKDIWPGKGSSNPSQFFAAGGFVYFSAFDPINGTELWKTDGTEAGTVLVKDIWPGLSSSVPFRFTVSNNIVYFLAEDPVNGRELWKTDGTSAGTSLVQDLVPGSASGLPNALDFISAGNYAYYAQGKLYKVDGTTNTMTELSSSIVNVNDLGVNNDTLYVIGRNAANQTILWKSFNGAAPVQVKILSSTITSGYQLTACNGKMYFNASNGSSGQEPWVSDGTEAGTYMLKDIIPGIFSSQPFQFVGAGSKVYFQAASNSTGTDFELWSTDGTEVGTVLVKDIFPGVSPGFPSGMISTLDNKLLFVANDGVSGVELWKSDGTTGGTSILQDFNTNGDGFVTPGRFLNYSQDFLLTKITRGLVFFARSSDKGNQLYYGDLPSKFYVNDNSNTGDVFTTAVGNNANAGTPSSPFATISHALSVAPAGSEIYVDAGTYAEQVIINKGITIRGAGAGITIIERPATDLIENPGNWRSGVISTLADIGELFIKNLTIKSQSNLTSTNLGFAIVSQAGGVISDCEIIGGNQGEGLFFTNSGTNPINVSVINNNIHNIFFLAVNFQGPKISAVVNNNTIDLTGSAFGMGVIGGGEPVLIDGFIVTGNIIKGFNGFGVTVTSNNPAGVVVSNNSFQGIGATQPSIQNRSASPINATCNWYGSADGAVVRAKITNGVNYTPWLTNGTDNNAAVGFQPIAGTCNGYSKLYVNDGSTSGDIYTTAIGNNSNSGIASAPFATIGYALSKTQPGDTIIIDAGSYTEIVNVTKDITLRGAGMGITILNGPAGPVTPFAGTFETGIIQSIAGVTNVIIENMTIDGTASGEQHGTFIQGGGRISNCELRYVNDGFYFQYLSTDARTAVGNNNYVHHINYVGALFAGNGLNATAANNVIDLTGAIGGMGFIAGYGGNGNLASFTASNNKIINSSNFGILVGSIQTAQINNNSLTKIAGNFIQNAHTVNVNATCNWYGTALAASIAPQITGNVTYSPWLIDGTDNSTDFGFQPSATCPVANSYYVNDNNTTGDVFTTAVGNDANSGTFNAPFATLNYALTQVPVGATIFVDAGTYAEPNLTIGKSVTILGSNYLLSPNDATNALNANGARTIEAIISNTTWTIGASDIKVKGFTFDPQSDTALAQTNNTLDFDNVEISNNIFWSKGTRAVVNLTGKQQSPLVTTNYVINDNRFVKESGGAGNNISINAIDAVQINNNVFTTNNTIVNNARIQNGISIGALAGDVVISNNHAFQQNIFVLGISAKKTTIAFNTADECNRLIFAGSSNVNPNEVEITDNIVTNPRTITGGPVISYVRNNGTNLSTPNIARIERNTITLDVTGLTAVAQSLIAPTLDAASLNTQVYIRSNKLTITGDFSSLTVPDAYVSAIRYLTNSRYTLVENNEMEFTATNFNPANKFGIGILTNNLQPGTSFNFLNNKFTGFPTSVAVQNSPNTNGFGGLPEGVVLNINYNSFTGDVVSINNGVVSQSANAGCNWYGSAAAQNFISKLTLPTVDIVPWLTNGSDNDAATGFQPVPNSCDGYPTLITLNSSTNVTCNGAANGTISITTTYGKAPFTYTWTKDEDAGFLSNSEDLTGLAPGTYTLSILDGNGSNIYITDPEADGPGVITVVITEPDVLTATASGDNNVCFNGTIGTTSVEATGGTAPYTYLWSNGVTTSSISNLAAGIYEVTVTDANGCTALSSYEVTQPSQLILSITNSSTACANIATVNASGGTPGIIPPYTYSWSNGSTSATISGVPVGTYTVTVTDNNGCTATASITLSVGEAFNPSASVTNVTCFGANDGIITVTNANGTGQLMFSKDGGVNFVNGVLPFSFNNLAPGTYNIAVKDENGCTGFVEKTVTQPTQITPSIVSVVNSCYGQSTGAVTVTVNGGSPAYSYSWTREGGGFSSSQLNISGVAAGNYTLTVTDKNGCTAVLPVTVPSNNEIIVNAAITNVLCRNTATGAINLTVTGGTGAGFIYSWTGALISSNEDLNNIGAANNYNVRITDVGSGCFVDRSYQVTQPAALTISTTGNNATGCNSLGTITATAGGGVGNFQYSINGGAYQTSNVFTGLYAGTYTVTVRDGNGCTATSASRTITDNGSDQYESNNSRTNSKPISIGTTINARLALATDIADWFVITTPAGGSSSVYSLVITHPTPGINYTFNLYPASPNNAVALTPTDVIGATRKDYTLNPGTSYRIGVTTTTLSFVCYSLSVNPLIPITSRNSTGAPIVSELPSNPLVDVLTSRVYPNPHRGSFTLNIESPEEGIGTVEMYNANGQLLGERKVNLAKGKGNMVQYNNMNHAVLFYRVHIGKHIVNGKIIGAN